MNVTDIPISSIIIAKRQRRNIGELSGLIASIQDIGLLHPIVVGTDYKLKAGYRRLEAYRQMGRDTIPAHVTDSLEDVLAALRAERDENMQRKDLTPSEIMDRAAELEEWERAEARKRQESQDFGRSVTSANFAEVTKGRYRDKVAEAFGVSGWTYEKAKQIMEAAEDQPDMFGDLPDKMDSKSVDAAYKEMRKRKREAERAAMAEKAKALPEDDRWRVVVGDVRTFELNRQVDFIITDPPYPKEYLSLYGVLAERALEWLKPGGLLLAMCGQSYFNQVVALMDEYLDYYWTGCYRTPGQPTPLRQRQVNTTWKPALIYTLPGASYKGKLFGDVWVSDGNDKDYHEWGQSVSGMSAMITQVCLPGQTIFDPFCGAGTTGIAALDHGCLFIGVDIDEKQVGIANKRLYDHVHSKEF